MLIILASAFPIPTPHTTFPQPHSTPPPPPSHAMQLVTSKCPNQGSNLFPPQWKCGVLTTVPPGDPLIAIRGVEMKALKSMSSCFVRERVIKPGYECNMEV